MRTTLSLPGFRKEWDCPVIHAAQHEWNSFTTAQASAYGLAFTRVSRLQGCGWARKQRRDRSIAKRSRRPLTLPRHWAFCDAKRRDLLGHLRTILAILIAMALSLAPVTSAWASASMHANARETVLAVAPPEDAMSDCMKAMQSMIDSTHGVAEKDCPCCDTSSKAACPEMMACLAKCGITAIAALSSGLATLRLVIRHDRPADPQKPPDWLHRPPAPPPKA
jgi:hypothetical protein